MEELPKQSNKPRRKDGFPWKSAIAVVVILGAVLAVFEWDGSNARTARKPTDRPLKPCTLCFSGKRTSAIRLRTRSRTAMQIRTISRPGQTPPPSQVKRRG